ncbi:MAG TPA: NAD-dependent epimerase/dehydratase family protein [Pyrinomonadaceae bacterium]|nr:NAD-dependent epimerase/dehydratase family protein [Pyrinomonadaceae bacterium]
MFWTNAKVLITGGASFIGSSLAKALIDRRAMVRVVDSLVSGKIGNIERLREHGEVEFRQADLRELAVAREVMKDVDYVFHLAADHGGRGYVDLHQAACATNFALDGVVINAAREVGVHKLIFASSGCVYPNHRQHDVDAETYLTEDMVQPPYDADNTYGWAKLMAELTLKAFYEDYGFRSVSCRYFTVYGPFGVENHAVMAMIAKAFIRQDPFEIWGDGSQIRNWTYIDDIVSGTLLAAEKIDDATPINLGTMERISVIEAAQQICKLLDHHPTFHFRPEMPTGPMNRVADNSLAQKLIGWSPAVSFPEGVKRTIEWYTRAKTVAAVQQNLSQLLLERA